MGRIVGIALAATVASTVLAASAGAGEPGTQVAPGIYFGSASEHGDADAELPPQVKKLLEAKRDSEPSAKIVGGQATTIEEWPWQAAILDGENGNGFDRQFCGGSLVAPNIVISAAHCFYDTGTDSFPPPTPPNDFDVVTGRTILSSTAGQELDVDNYFFLRDGSDNPLYDPDVDDQFDVVFIKLAWDSVSQTIKIAGPGERSVWTAGRTAFTTGWGSLSSGGPFPDRLREVQIGMISDAVCGSGLIYGASGLFFPATMVCAGVLVTGGKDSCQGDSGGPLVVPIAGGGFRLVGDTSFGIGCGLPDKPGVYGRIADNPMRNDLAAGILAESGVNVLGSGAEPPPAPPPPPPAPPPPGPSAECLDAQAALDKAKKKLKKAKRKLRKAKSSDAAAKVKKAKKKVKKAKRKKRKAKNAVEELC